MRLKIFALATVIIFASLQIHALSFFPTMSLGTIKDVYAGDCTDCGDGFARPADPDVTKTVPATRAIRKAVDNNLYSVKVMSKKWKTRHKVVQKRVRGWLPRRSRRYRGYYNRRGFGWYYKNMRVADGGWYTIRIKIKAENLPRKAIMADLTVFINGMVGEQYETHTKPGTQLIKNGNYFYANLRIYVAQSQLRSFWLKKAKTAVVQSKLVIRPYHIVYEDGSEVFYN